MRNEELGNETPKVDISLYLQPNYLTCKVQVGSNGMISNSVVK